MVAESSTFLCGVSVRVKRAHIERIGERENEKRNKKGRERGREKDGRISGWSGGTGENAEYS